MNPMLLRKIIHIDMDCFYAAIEMRDNPTLINQPVAVGGTKEERGVICTANYAAREFGVHSAMPTATAFRLCKNLIVLPVNMPKYKEVAQRIYNIFCQYTHLVEPLALDEAYLDVSNSLHHQGSATLIAEAIRKKIFASEQLTASAGVANNKFLTKIASGFRKPNGLFVIHPNQVENFIKTVAVEELYGVGKITAQKLRSKNLTNCADLQKLSQAELTAQFGKLGQHLFEQCRGLDYRKVEPNRERKSLSVEHTFPQDVKNLDMCLAALQVLYEKLLVRIGENAAQKTIKNQFVRLKFNNFRLVSSEAATNEIKFEIFKSLFLKIYKKINMPLRLLGVGVHFNDKTLATVIQQSLF